MSIAALASASMTLGGVLQNWPVWGIGLAAVVPWLPVFVAEAAWIYRRHAWLALFYVLIVTQVGHLLEHVAQMTQIHLLHHSGAQAQGIFGALDIEWVHFIWNAWVLLAVILLLQRFPKNRWLWATALLAGWHEMEHLVVFSTYLLTGRAGTPGLLGQGGLIAGGLPIRRAELHFLYNLIETIPLVGSFVWQFTKTMRSLQGSRT